MFIDYYDILGIERSATGEEIKQSFRNLAMIYHPDSNSSPEAHSKFLAVNEAYQILSDISKRYTYNSQYDHYVRLQEVYTEPGFTTRPDEYEGEESSSTKEPAFSNYKWVSRILSVLTLIFGLSIAIDYFQAEVSPIQTMLEKKLTQDAQGDQTCIVRTEAYEFNIDYDKYEKLGIDDRIILHTTPYYGVLVRIDVQSPLEALVNATPGTTNLTTMFSSNKSLEGSFSMYPHYGIYNVFSFFLIGLIASSIAALALYQRPKLVFKLTLANILLALISALILFQS